MRQCRFAACLPLILLLSLLLLACPQAGLAKAPVKAPDWLNGTWRFDLTANQGKVPQAMYDQGKTLVLIVDTAAGTYLRSVDGRESSVPLRNVTLQDGNAVVLETGAGAVTWTKISPSQAQVSSGKQSIVLIKEQGEKAPHSKTPPLPGRKPAAVSGK